VARTSAGIVEEASSAYGSAMSREETPAGERRSPNRSALRPTAASAIDCYGCPFAYRSSCCSSELSQFILFILPLLSGGLAAKRPAPCGGPQLVLRRREESPCDNSAPSSRVSHLRRRTHSPSAHWMSPPTLDAFPAGHLRLDYSRDTALMRTPVSHTRCERSRCGGLALLCERRQYGGTLPSAGRQDLS